MKIRNLAYATFVAVAARRIRDRFGCAQRSSQEEEGSSCSTTGTGGAQWPTCWGAPYGPVCATKGGQNFSYINACYAMKDGASKAKAGACKQAKAGGKKKKA